MKLQKKQEKFGHWVASQFGKGGKVNAGRPSRSINMQKQDLANIQPF